LLGRERRRQDFP